MNYNEREMNEMVQEKEYFAFISYQRKDEEWADRLRNKLEHYRFPSSVRKLDASLPKEIRPIFRDALELTGGFLAKEIETALQQSKYLIVICSPYSAKSPWVNKEIQTFIELGREDRIIPFIIEDTPFSDNEEMECFPPALRSLKGEKELLAININELGRDAASIKVVAHMFGLKFDTLWQKYEREQKRTRWMIIGGALLFGLVCLAIGIYVWRQKQQADKANWSMMENQARAVAEKSKQEIAKGNVKDALLALLEVHPSESKKRPYVPEVDEAMRFALYSLQHGGYNYQILGRNIQIILCPRKGNVFLLISKDGIVEVYSKKVHNTINSFRIANKTKEQLFESEFILSVDNRKLLVVDSLTLQIYDISKGQMAESLPLDRIDKNKERELKSEFMNAKNTIKDRYFTSKIDDNKCISYNALTHIALFYHELQHVDGTDDAKPIGYYALVNLDNKNELFRKYDYPSWEGPYNISDIELSPNGEFLAIAYYSGDVEEYNIRQGVSKIWKNLSDDYSEHYSNSISYSFDSRIIFQTSAFQNNIKFIDSQSMNLKDSICNVNPEGASVYAEGDNCEILCLLENILYIYYKEEHTTSPTVIYHNSLSIDENKHRIHDRQNHRDYLYSPKIGLGRKKGEDVVKALEREKQFVISTESDGISFKDHNNPKVLWKHSNILESVCVGYTSDYKYLFIVDVGYRGAYELKILEMNTGKSIYEPNCDYSFDDFYYSESEGLLLLKQFNGDMLIEAFPMYNNLAKTCQKRVKGMSLSTRKKHDFFIE